MKKTAKIVFLMLLATILCFSLFACNHKDASDHKPTGDWKSDATHHWHACENDKCVDAGDKAEHVYDNACDTTCNVCQATRNITHSHADTLTAGDTTHYYLCSVCGDKKDEAVHTFDKEVASDDYYVSNDTTTITYNKSCVCGVKGTETFTVDKEPATLTVNVADKVYDGQLATIDIQTNSTGTQAKYYYEWNDETDSWDMLNEALTKNAGKYKVQVIVYADDTYKATTVEKEFEVTPKLLAVPTAFEKVYDGTNVIEYTFDASEVVAGETVKVKLTMLTNEVESTAVKNAGEYDETEVQFETATFYLNGNETQNYYFVDAYEHDPELAYDITINKKVIGNLTYNTTYLADATTNGIVLTLTSTHGMAPGEYLFIKIDAEDVIDYEAGQTYDLVLSESDAGNGKLVAYLSGTNDNYIVDIETIKLRVS